MDWPKLAANTMAKNGLAKIGLAKVGHHRTDGVSCWCHRTCRNPTSNSQQPTDGIRVIRTQLLRLRGSTSCGGISPPVPGALLSDHLPSTQPQSRWLPSSLCDGKKEAGTSTGGKKNESQSASPSFDGRPAPQSMKVRAMCNFELQQ